MPNSAFVVSGNVMVVMHNHSSPSAEEWKHYLAGVLQMVRNCDGDLANTRQIVFTDGGGPDVGQRQAAVDAIASFRNQDKAKVAVVSSSTVVRGIVTVFNWFKLNVKSFAPERAMDAFKFLDFTPAQAAWVWRTVDEHNKSIERGPLKSTMGRRGTLA